MTFTTQEVLAAGRLCEDIYDPSDPGASVDDLRWSAQGLGHTVLVGFRGTANTRNALRDVTVFPPKAQDGHLGHRGFARAFEKLIPAIDAMVFEPDLDVIFAGHSFGGALAERAAHHYNKRAITFGCPANYFWFAPQPDINHYRVICDDDPVPKLPLISGRHACRPSLVLRDDDFQWIDVEDHFMKEYNRRLAIWAGVMKR